MGPNPQPRRAPIRYLCLAAGLLVSTTAWAEGADDGRWGYCGAPLVGPMPEQPGPGPEGAVVCGTVTNLFLRRGERVCTPNVDGLGVAGVMRGWLLEALAGLGYSVQQAPLDDAALASADELLVTNSLIGLWPVARLEDSRYAAPGALATRLLARLRYSGVIPDWQRIANG